MEEYYKKEESNKNRKTLCIIGGGISGIISAKLAADKGLEVTIFEKNPQLKGIWSDYGYAWAGMSLNVSKFNNSLLDFMWNDTDKIFPSREDFQKFIQAYVNKYSIHKYVKLNTTVTNVKLLSNTNSAQNRFSVIYTNNMEEAIKEFDYVIIATGMFSKPKMVGLDMIKHSNVELIHSSAYRKPEDYRNKNVLVVGNSHSACQIASEICRSAKSVTNVFRKPQWIIPYYLYSKKYDKQLPYDFIIFGNRKNLKIYSHMNSTCAAAENKVKNKFFSKFSMQNSFESALNIDENSEENHKITISENYMKYVKEGLIIPIKAEIDSIISKGENDQGGVFITSNMESQLIKVDTIILCTGYNYDPSILDKSLLDLLVDKDDTSKKINFDILNVFNSKIRNLAFVGMEYGIVLQTYQFQATLALNYLLDENFSIDSNSTLFHRKFAKNEIIPYLETIAICTGFAPDIAKIKEEDKDLYEMLMEGPIIPQHYGLYDYGSELYKKSAEYVKRFNGDLNKTNNKINN